MSLVRVTGWINRFLANVKKPQSDRESGELNPRELKQAEEEIIKTAQQECFPDEIRAIKDNKPKQECIAKDYTKVVWGTPSIKHATEIFR